MPGEDPTQTGVRVDGWLPPRPTIRKSAPRNRHDGRATDDSWLDSLPETGSDVTSVPVSGPPPGSHLAAADAPGWASPPAGRRRHRRDTPSPPGDPDAGELAEELTDTQSYSRVDLLRLARRRQRRKWLLTGLAVTAVLVVLVSYLRPRPPAEHAEPLPSAGYALPPFEPGVPYEPEVRVPGLNPVMSPPAPTTAAAKPSEAAGAAAGPLVTVAQAAVPSMVDLSAVGTVDWVHWGLRDTRSIDRKRDGGHEIADQGGRGDRGRYDNNPQRFAWHDGERERFEGGTSTGVYSCDVGNGFTLAIAAGPQQRTLRLYAGVWRARGRLQVRLSSGGPAGTAALENRASNGTAEFTITFRAPTDAYLLVSWTADEVYQRRCGNVSLQAAALG